jgi:hypothetical protein
MIASVVLRDPMMVMVSVRLCECGRGRTPTDQGGDGKRRRDLSYLHD